MLNRGARVALVARNIRDIQPIGVEFPSQVICIQCDLGIDLEQCDMVNGAIDALGGLDILINAAGVFFENDLESTFPQDHDYIMSINLRSIFFISQLCAPSLAKNEGCIVNISNSSRPQQGMISYCMSKAGVDMLTKALSLELYPIRVNAVAPSLINNNFLTCSKISDQEIKNIKRHVKEKNPMTRLARIDEIVKSIIFLCSSKAKQITGEIIQVDGGLHCTSSSFIHWNTSRKMNCKIMPDGLKPINQFASWFGKKIDLVLKDDPKHPDWINILMKKSNWYTSLPDAHTKIADNYQKIEDDIDALGILESLKQYEIPQDESYQSNIRRNSLAPGSPVRLGRLSMNLDDTPRS